MASDKPIKCAAKEFKAEPFYLVQSNGKEQRFVAYCGDIDKIKSILDAFMNRADGEIQIRIRDYDDRENPVEFDGIAVREELNSILETYEEFIFHDGFHDFMMRHPDSGDYLVFDEHGLVFIYSKEDYSDKLNKLGLAYKANEKLIYEFGHWHYRPAKAREDLLSLIKELGLQ